MMQSTAPEPQDAAKEVESIKAMVERRFKVYETRLNADSIQFHCEVDKAKLDENFRALRAEVGPLGYTAILTYQRGEHVLTIGKLPKAKTRGVWVNVVLLVATIATTVLAGMELWLSYSGKGVDSFFSLETVAMGALTFALPLMAILSIHEMSHYLAAKRHGVPASFPFFIPAPFVFIGTFGAFISIRGPIPDRRALFDLGVAGPIAGFIASIPVAILGISLTASGAAPLPAETGGAISISLPAIYQFLGLFMPMPENVLMHPVAMAGWVGFLVTAINLLPAGSLDGGHIARAVFGPKAKYATWAAIIVMMALGMFLYSGWLIFALLILLLGTDHSPPLNDITPIPKNRKILSLGVVAILVSCFAIIPMETIPADYSFEAELEGSSHANVSMGLNHTFTILLASNGNINTTLVFDIQPSTLKSDLSLGLKYRIGNSTQNESAPGQEFTIPVNENATAYLSIILSDAILQSTDVNGSILISVKDAPEINRTLPINVSELAGNYSYVITPGTLSFSGNQTKSLHVNVTNNYSYDLHMQITAIPDKFWSVWLYDIDPANATSRLNLIIGADSNASFTINVTSPLTVTAGDTVTLTIVFVSLDSNEMKEADVQISTV